MIKRVIVAAALATAGIAAAGAFATASSQGHPGDEGRHSVANHGHPIDEVQHSPSTQGHPVDEVRHAGGLADGLSYRA